MTTPGESDYFRLRAEWLRFKNHVFDANTELPTLAAVLDDVRRLMGGGGTRGLLYLALGGDGGGGRRSRATAGRATTSWCARSRRPSWPSARNHCWARATSWP